MNQQIFQGFSRNYSGVTAKSLSKYSQKPVICTLIPGDGIGPELMNSVKCVFSALKVPLKFETHLFSELDPLSESLKTVLASIAKNKVCLKGPFLTPSSGFAGELQTYFMKLRVQLDVFASVVHAKSIPGVPTRHKDIDLIVIREQTEGEYSALEHESVRGVVECSKIITAEKSLRIAKFAFDYATKLKRKKVTAIHKANIMKLSDGLFLACCEKVAKLYPHIKYSTMIVDNCTMQMIKYPQQFDVMVMTNLYGNIINNIASGLLGGAYLVPGAEYSAECVIFSPSSKIPQLTDVGRNIANPTAMLLCAAQLLKYVGLKPYGSAIQTAVYKVLKDRKIRTVDLGGTASSNEFTDAIIHNSRITPKEIIE